MERGGEEESVDLRLQVHLHDGTTAGPYCLVPRWESRPPQATGERAAAVGGDTTSSSTSSGGALLPVAPSPPEKVALILTRGSLVTSIPLVSCNSKQGVHELRSIEGNVYVKLEINPVSLHTVLRFYEVDPGKGTEGKVYLCSSNFSKNNFAVKKVDQVTILARNTHEEPSDVSVLARCGHNNVLELYLAWSAADMTHSHGHAIGSIFVAMKPCARSLHQYLRRTETLDVETSKHIVKQLMEGLAYIHELGIAHRDIKPESILLEQDLTVKITKAKRPPEILEFRAGIYGSAPYRAPELQDVYSRHDEMVDIYSAGMIYSELCMPSLHKRKKKLKQLSGIIRQYAQQFDLLARPPEVPGAQQPGVFNLDVLLNGTHVIDDWTGNLKLLQNMINPERKKSSSALKILELLEDKIAEDVGNSNGSTRLRVRKSNIQQSITMLTKFQDMTNM